MYIKENIYLFVQACKGVERSVFQHQVFFCTQHMIVFKKFDNQIKHFFIVLMIRNNLILKSNIKEDTIYLITITIYHSLKESKMEHSNE